MMQNVQNVSFRKGQDQIKATVAANAAMHVQTVQGNYKGHTKREVMRAKEARRAQAMMGNPSKKDFKGMVCNNIVPNCPIDCHDIDNDLWIRPRKHPRENGQAHAGASGGGLRCYSAGDRGTEPNCDDGGRCIFCGWHSISGDVVSGD
jgi:hypothetical protein